MSERRPRLNKKLNSNDRKAMVRIMSVLLRNCIAVPPSLELQLHLAESKRKAISGKAASTLIFMKDTERRRNATCVSLHFECNSCRFHRAMTYFPRKICVKKT